MVDYTAAIERMKSGAAPSSLTAKLMIALLKIQYDQRVPSNTKKAAVADMLAAAIAQTPLNVALDVGQEQASVDEDSEVEEQADATDI
jgi:hypothetical protein